MESGAIGDEQLSASSSYVSTVGAPHARLNGQRAGGGWCPKPQIEADSKEYIEVDLRDVHILTEVATQGRDNKGRGQEYMEEYSIEYFRPKIGGWKEYKRWDGKKLFTGNSDTTKVVRHRLEPAVYATKIRLLPYSAHRRTVCARIELYGCQDRSGLVSYTVPPSAGVLGDLSDTTYDGTALDDGTLVDGLGRLVDGRVGADSFTLDVGHGKGTGWVAWQDSSFPRKCIDLLFEFSSIRNFTEITIYTNNYYSKKSQVFGQAVVFFHIDGMLYLTEPVVFHPRAELQSQKAKNVSIKIPDGGIAKQVKLRLYFVQTWIMVSEIYFSSEPMVDNITEETLKMLLIDDEDPPVFDKQGNIVLEDGHNDTSNTSFYVNFVLGTITTVLITISMVYLSIFYYKKYTLGIRFRRVFYGNKYTGWIVNWTSREENEPENEPNNIEPMSQSRVKLELRPIPSEPDLTHESEVAQPQRRGGHQPKQTVAQVTKRGYSTTLRRARMNTDAGSPVDDANQGPTHSGNQLNNTRLQIQKYNTHERFEYNPQREPRDRVPRERVHREQVPREQVPREQVPREQVQSTSRSHRRRASNGTLDQSIEVDTKYDGLKRGRYACRPIQTRIQYLLLGRHSLLPLSKIQLGPDYLWNIGPSDTSPPACPDGELVPVPAYGLTLHSTHSSYLDREIRLCTTEKLKVVLKNAPSMVQVRYAHMYQSDDCAEYYKEVRMLASLSHPSLCNVIGVATNQIPPLIVQEFATGQDLCRMLRNANKSISFQIMISITTQICSAMRYLECKSMVHRDLGARNCVIYSDKRIKVTDLAMYSNKYKTDYYVTPSGRKLALRWLSWEAILLGQTSTASTVWSFAVTAWEILQYCSNKPFASFTNEQIVEIHEHLFYGGELHSIIKDALPMPRKCPLELYKMLQRCWRKSELDRPTFDEIYKFILLHYHEDLPHEYML